MNFGLRTAIALAASSDGAPPEWVHLLPAGDVAARDGRRWHGDPAAIVERSRAYAGETQPAIDWEHQGIHAEKNGEDAPAAGWIEELEARADGVWGRVSWNDKARGQLERREYRYLSPTFTFDRATHEVLELTGAGLTNRPALDLTALAKARAADEPPTGEQPMKLPPELMAALGMAAEVATLEAAVARAKGLIAENAHARALCEAFGIESDDPEHQLAAARAIAAAQAQQAEGGGGEQKDLVPRSELERISTELAELRASVAAERAAAAVDAAVASGRIAPANREWAMGRATRDLADFEELCSVMPVQIEAGESGVARGPRPGAGAGADGLTSTERAVCKQTGITPEAFLAERKRLADEATAQEAA